MQSPFPLPPSGEPGAALLWKGMLQVRRGSVRRNALAGAALAVALGVLPPALGAPPWIPAAILATGLVLLGLSGWVVPLHPRNDLRSDLLRLEVIRPWPLPASRVFAWEALGPALEGLLAAAFAACLVVSADLGMRLSSAGARRSEMLDGLGLEGPLAVPLLVLGLLPLAAALSWFTAVLINLVVLYAPGWGQLGAHKPQGAAAFGHNLLLSLGLLVAHTVVFAAAAVLVGSVLFVQLGLLGLPPSAWELPLLGLLAALPAVAAAALGVRLGGILWERLDASREVLEHPG